MEKYSIVSISIIFSRAVYSMYWVYLSPAYIYYMQEFSIPKSFLGYISWSFIVGSAVTQMPASYLASCRGPVKVYLLGLFLLSFSGIFSAFSFNFQMLLITRIIAGAGAGLFFSTAGYVLSYINQKRLGFWMGVYNAAFAVGAITAYAYGMLYTYTNWKVLVSLMSFFGVMVTLTDYFLLRSMNIKIEIDTKRPKITKNIKPLLVAVAISGFWGTYYAAETLLPSYFAIVNGSVKFGNEVTIMLLVFSFVGGFFNYFYDVSPSKRLFLFVTVFLGGIGFLMFSSKELFYLGLFLIGFFDEMAFSALYAISLQLSEEKYSAMALSVVNFINMVLGMWISIVFSYSMVYLAKYLWLLMFLITVIPSVPLLHKYFEPNKSK
ncbi:MAG: MFS transporter [Thaumarchaeota archaeon]|nr:MFS transporter [Nitrososphaerota archaeon]